MSCINLIDIQILPNVVGRQNLYNLYNFATSSPPTRTYPIIYIIYTTQVHVKPCYKACFSAGGSKSETFGWHLG